MTPSARIEATIAILGAIGNDRSKPADGILADWFRSNRYAGSKDKAAIASTVYAVLRNRGAIDWWLSRVDGDTDERGRVIAYLALGEGKRLTDLEQLFDGERFSPDPLTPREKRFVIEFGDQRGLMHDCMPVSAKCSFPEWMQPELEALYDADVERQMAAYLDEAPVDLRVNLLKGDRVHVRKLLQVEGVEADPLERVREGLRLPKRMPLSSTQAFKDGLVEVQDEGSQIAAALVEAGPGMRIVDFCAGAGGKTLAIAASMANKGRIVACDVSESRLKRAATRLKRAGAFTVERKPLASENDPWVKRHSARNGKGFDRVLIDAPCSGTGTWRRNPDQKWRLSLEDVQELTERQDSILASAQRLVNPGGRLIYVTCSILKRENEDRIAAFLEKHLDFFIHPVGDIWPKVLDGACPADGDMLRLEPADHGTDGFFVAVLGRKMT